MYVEKSIRVYVYLEQTSFRSAHLYSATATNTATNAATHINTQTSCCSAHVYSETATHTATHTAMHTATHRLHSYQLFRCQNERGAQHTLQYTYTRSQRTLQHTLQHTDVIPLGARIFRGENERNATLGRAGAARKPESFPCGYCV